MARDTGTMRGLWLESGSLSLRDDLPVPRPAHGEALVRVLLAGVCHTDHELLRGYAGFRGIPGHEFVGEVVRGPRDLAGRRVVGEINVGCNACPRCRRGQRNHCERRQVLGIRSRHGAFAEYLTLPSVNLHPVPDSLPDRAAVFTEPLAAAFRVAEQVELGPGTRLLVVGDGKLGQLVARVARLAGADTSVQGHHARKLELLEPLGITTLLGPPGTPCRYDVVVECTGSPSGFADAVGAVRPGGRLVLKSTHAAPLTLDASVLVVNEIQVVGSRCGPFAPALQALTEGRVDPGPLIDAVHGLSDGVAAVAGSARHGALKVLLRPE